MAFFPKEEGCGEGLTVGSPPPSRGDFSPLCSPPHPSPVHTHLPWKSPPKECCLSNPWGEMEDPQHPSWTSDQLTHPLGGTQALLLFSPV